MPENCALTNTYILRQYYPYFYFVLQYILLEYILLYYQRHNDCITLLETIKYFIYILQILNIRIGSMYFV